jgi:RNA-directed DNA polymerase
MNNYLDKVFSLVSEKKGTIQQHIIHNQIENWYGNEKNLEPFQLNSLIFLSIDKPIFFLKLLHTSKDIIQKNIDNPQYKEFAIPKKKGGSRKILAPNDELKSIQKKLNEYLQNYYYWIKPSESHGFTINPYENIKTCNILENAKPHVGKKHVLNLDLKDFFPNISAKSVYKIFKSEYFRFDDEIAILFTLLLTYKGNLPIGAPTSPVISNFICLKLDQELLTFANNHKLTYTRYADDLTFSSDDLIDTNSVEEIKKLIINNNFQINQKKVRLSRNSSKQTVTGIIVNEKPNIDRVYLKKIRAMLHDLNQNGISKATKNHFKIKFEDENLHQKFLNKLGGYINFVGQIKGKQDITYRKFKKKFSAFFNVANKDDDFEGFDGFDGDLWEIRVPLKNIKSNL